MRPLLAARMHEVVLPQGKRGGFDTYSWEIESQKEGGDLGMVTVKEALSDDGTLVPMSVWFSGRFDPEWEGLAKVLSLQMQISDLSLIASTLRRLEGLHDEQAEYGWALQPGSEKQRYYGSTLAYIAALLRHRYSEAGLLDADGEPTRQLGLFDRDADRRPLPVATTRAGGMHCTQCCESNSVEASSGCLVCRACGHNRCS